MAILGFLTHTVEGKSKEVEAALAAMPELSTYGIHQDCYVVVVAEADSADLEGLMSRVHALDGVLTTYVTSLNVEDEQ
ncbi:chaperone NapD [Desulfovibrio sp. OttesenSCG-928-A18]|nr:chaperone NapD [Desulfovibrio sp. OttesenSCG-928-A18]